MIMSCAARPTHSKFSANCYFPRLQLRWILIIIIMYFTTIISSISSKGHYRDDGTAKRHNNSTLKSVEKKLIQFLLDRYERSGVVGRPVNHSEVKIFVQYGLALIQILDLDENKQILRTNCWSRYKWEDTLLQWNPEEYGNISQIRVFPDQLWTPDIKLYNFADERMKEHRTARVVVYNTGLIIWIPQALFKSTCAVQILDFPFDKQECVLEFGSWSYDITQLEIGWWIPDMGPQTPSPYVDYTNYVESNEWVADGQREREMNHTDRVYQERSKMTYRTIVFHRPDGSVLVRKYRILQYVIKLQRNPSFYVSILVIPCILLSTLTLVLFWLPPESPAKMMLGMNIFVAFFILLLLLAESTPSAVKDFPLIGSYFCLNMIMITLSTFVAVTVINLYFRGDKKGPVPQILRRIMLEGLGSLLLVRQNIPLVDEDKLKKILQTTNPSPCHHGKSRMIPNMRYNKFLNDDPVAPRQPGDIAIDDSPILSGFGMSNLECEVHEIKRFIRSFANRQKDKERRNLVAMQWRTLALVLDRLFFCLYVVAISLAIILLIPR